MRIMTNKNVVKDDSDIFSLSDYKIELPLTEMGKIGGSRLGGYQAFG